MAGDRKTGSRSREKISKALTKDAPFKQAAELLIKALSEGVSPWQQPWENVAANGAPRNAVSNRTYSMGNLFMLMLTASMAKYNDPRWLTYKQASDIGAQVRGGEKGTRIFFYSQSRKDLTEEQVASGKYSHIRQDPDTGQPYVNFPLLRSYTVFNAAQCDNMPPLERSKLPDLKWSPVERAEAVVAEANPEVRHEPQNVSCYRPFDDYILMPMREQFPTAEDYYSTLLHELGHWTGHESRLNRDMSGDKRSLSYAREELTAELISIYMAFETEIKPQLDQSAAYIDSWLRNVSVEDLTVAMNDAAKATRFLLPKDPERELERGQTTPTAPQDPQPADATPSEEEETVAGPSL